MNHEMLEMHFILVLGNIAGQQFMEDGVTQHTANLVLEFVHDILCNRGFHTVVQRNVKDSPGYQSLQTQIHMTASCGGSQRTKSLRIV
jgi:hypothetical protein